MFVFHKKNCVTNGRLSAFAGDVVKLSVNPGAVISGFPVDNLEITFINGGFDVIGFKQAGPAQSCLGAELHLPLCDIIDFSIIRKRSRLEHAASPGEEGAAPGCRIEEVPFLFSPESQTLVQTGDKVSVKTKNSCFSGTVSSILPSPAGGCLIFKEGPRIEQLSNIVDISAGCSGKQDEGGLPGMLYCTIKSNLPDAFRALLKTMGEVIISEGQLVKAVRTAGRGMAAVYDYNGIRYMLRFKSACPLTETPGFWDSLVSIEEMH